MRPLIKSWMCQPKNLHDRRSYFITGVDNKNCRITSNIHEFNKWYWSSQEMVPRKSKFRACKLVRVSWESKYDRTGVFRKWHMTTNEILTGMLYTLLRRISCMTNWFDFEPLKGRRHTRFIIITFPICLRWSSDPWIVSLFLRRYAENDPTWSCHHKPIRHWN